MCRGGDRSSSQKPVALTSSGDEPLPASILNAPRMGATRRHPAGRACGIASGSAAPLVLPSKRPIQSTLHCIHMVAFQFQVGIDLLAIVFGKDFQESGESSFAAEIKGEIGAPTPLEIRPGLDRIIIPCHLCFRGGFPVFGTEEDLFGDLELGVIEITAAVVFVLSGEQSGGRAPAGMRVPVVLPG